MGFSVKIPRLVICVCLLLALALTGCTQTAPTNTVFTVTPYVDNPNITMSVTFEPTFDDPEGDITFTSLVIEKGVLPGNNFSPLYPVPHEKGDPCFIFTGKIKNTSSTRYWVAIHAHGYDSLWNEMSFTLDCGPICGVSQIDVAPNSEEYYLLYLSYSANITQFVVHTQKSAQMFM
jgi:hypothetical protein